MLRSTLVALFLTAQAAMAGLTVVSVIPGGAAEAAGFAAEDRLVSVAGKPVASMDELQAATSAYRPGDTVPVVVERGGSRTALQLTFGSRPSGEVSIGVRLEFEPDPDAADTPGTVGCREWIETTYRLGASIREHDLGLEAVHRDLLACVRHDTQRMSSDRAIRFCDNVLKVHCSGVDLLAEIAEVHVGRCEAVVRERLNVDPGKNPSWTTCGQHRIHERYAKDGQVAGPDDCIAAFEEPCGTIPAASTGDGSLPEAPGSAVATGAAADTWRQWGGPARDFRVPAAKLATSWPEGGPRQVWSRGLGDGFASIVAEAGRLFTSYRDGDREAIVSLDAGTGETLWEYRYPARIRKQHVAGYGVGPRSTPLVVGDRVFAVGVSGQMHALDKRTGKPLWERELWGAGFAGKGVAHGYSASPLAHGDAVIVAFGDAEEAGLLSLAQADGTERWRASGFENSYSSPAIRTLAGRPTLVAFVAEALIGLDPDDGARLWSYPHANEWGHNITMPLPYGDDILFLSSPQAGARGIRLSGGDGAVEVEELWSNRRVQFYYGTAVTDGEWAYGASGTSVAFFVAVNMQTGELGWRERGFTTSTVLASGDKLLILDEDGRLRLATATPKALTVHAETRLLGERAWAAPILVGTTLYARDTERIVAVDLGAAAPQTPSTRRDTSKPSDSKP